MFRDRSLAGLISAELLSLTGSAMTYIALPWFVLATTGSTAKMGWVLAAEMLPIAVVGIPAGSVISRLGAKRTMLLCDAARGPLMLVIPILHRAGHLSFPALLAVTFAIGVFSAPYLASSRIVIPEIVGEDERAVAQVSAVLAGANQIAQIAGPLLAGLLIAATSPSTVLVIDGCSYVLSFLTIAVLVGAGRRVAATAESHGVFAGVRFLIRDSLLRPLLIAACVVNFGLQGLIVGLQGLAYFRYDANAHILGYLFGALGLGALCGAFVAQQLTRKADLYKLAALAIVAMPLPLFLLGLSLPAAVSVLVVAAFGFFGPLVNAPIIGMLTVRTPEALRGKVMTAVLTVATMAGPLGFLAAGEALRFVSFSTFFVVLPTFLALGGLGFAAALLANRPRQEALPAADVAHG